MDTKDMSSFQVVEAIQDKITPEFEQQIEQALDDKEWSAIGALPTAIKAMTLFPELLAQLPPVNSAPPSKDKHRGPILSGNVPTDFYPIERVTKKGDRKPSWRSHSQDLAERSPIGKAIAEELVAIKEANQEGMKATGKYATLDKPELLALENHWKPKHSAHVKLWRDVIGISQQLRALSDCKNLLIMIQTTPVKQARSFVMPMIEGAPWIQGTADKPQYLYPTKSPFHICKLVEQNGRQIMQDYRAVSISELLSWDVAKAGGEDATVESLAKSVSRGPGTPPEMQTKITGNGKLYEYLCEVQAYLDNAKARTDFAGFMHKGGGRDMLTVAYRLRERLNTVFGADSKLAAMAAKAIAEDDDGSDAQSEEKAA